MTIKRGHVSLKAEIRKLVGKIVAHAHPIDRAALQKVLAQYHHEGWRKDQVFLFDVLKDNVGG